MSLARTAFFLMLAVAAATGCRRDPAAGEPLPAGSLEQVNAREIVGWAWDHNTPSTPVRVEILADDRLVTTVKADLYREDLKRAGLGNGRHQFRVPMPDLLKDGKPHLIGARMVGTTNQFRNSPKSFQGMDGEGVLEHISPSEIVGWAFDRARPGDPVEVEIWDGDKLLGRVKADLYREDLKTAGLGNGRHQFRFAVPASLRDGQPHMIHARFAGSEVELRKSPVSLPALSSPNR